MNHVNSNHINTNSNRVHLNHTNLNYVDLNHAESNKLIPDDLTNIGSINDLSKICALHQILSYIRDSTESSAIKLSNRTPFDYVSSIHTYHKPSLLYLFHSYPPVPVPQIFTYGTSEPPSPLHDSSVENVVPKGNTTTRNNPPNMLPKVPADPDSYPSSSYSSLKDSSDSSDNNYSRLRRRTKKNKNKFWSKNRFNDPIKKCPKLTSNILTSLYISNIVHFKLV